MRRCTGCYKLGVTAEASHALPPGRSGSPRMRRLSVGLMAAITAIATVGSALSPWLLVEHPLALVAFSPDVRHLVLLAAQADFGPVLAVSLPRRALGILATYGVGYFYGPVAIAWAEHRAPRFGAALRWLERQFARFGAVLLVVYPSYTLGSLAGAAGTPMRVFVPAMLVGQFGYIAAAYYFGDAVRDWTQPILVFLTEHMVASTAVCVGLVLAWQVKRRLSPGDEPPLGRD